MWFRLLVAVLIITVAFVSLAAQTSAQASAGGPSTSFRVAGDVEHRAVYRLDSLKALSPHTVDVSFEGPGGLQSHHFTGVLLEDLVSAAAPRFDPNRKNDFLRWSARVHATDNYEVIVAFSEFDPGFENKQVLIAYADNGQPLTTTGFARLVVPGDSKGGRYVSNVNLIAFDPPRLGPRFHFACFDGD
jgi:Oxidoreductase molybdopterin binding domain